MFSLSLGCQLSLHGRIQARTGENLQVRMQMRHSKVPCSSCEVLGRTSPEHSEAGWLTTYQHHAAVPAAGVCGTRGAVSTPNVPTVSDPAPPSVLVSQSLCGLGTNGGSQIVTRPQAELCLHSTIPEFPGPNMRQRKGSSICALPNTRRCKPRWQLPLCSTFSLFFSRWREPSLVSDAECVFAVYVQRDWSSCFRTGTGREEQSFVPIANLNTFFFFFLAPASANPPLNMKQGHDTSACLHLSTPVLHLVLD